MSDDCDVSRKGETRMKLFETKPQFQITLFCW